MPKQTWIIATILSALVLAGIGILSFSKQGTELALAREALAKTEAELQGRTSDLSALSNKLAEAEESVAELSEKSKEAETAQHSIEAEMRKALESRDVTISELKGRLTVNIVDRVLFESGEAELKSEGQKVLAEIATVLAQHTNRQIHVVGHTDDIPIRRKYSSNWDLSAARAIAAVRFLQEHSGVDPRRLGAVGYGEFHPVAENTTAEGRARNRRIEIVILPEEIHPTSIVARTVDP